MSTTGHQETAHSYRKPGKESDTRLYVMATLLCFGLASATYILAKPEEKAGPPQHEHAQGMPEGHPPTQGGGVGEEQLTLLNRRIDDLRAALANDPEDDDSRLGLANLLYDHGQIVGNLESFRESQEHYTRYLQNHPNNPDARTDRAYTMYRLGDVDGSIEELRKVRSIDPSHQQATFNLGIMFKEKNQPDSVLAYMAITAEIDTTSHVGRAALQVLQAYRDAH